MLEKAFLLGVAAVGGFASLMGTLPAFLIALFGTPNGVLTTAYITSATEDAALANMSNQEALAQYAQELGTAQGEALAQALGSAPPATTAQTT